MRKLVLVGLTAAVFAGSSAVAVYAQHRPWSHHHHQRLSMEDRAAFADARIAAVKAGLKLTPDQEKLWPPVESAVRDYAKLRIDRANARMEQRDARRDDDRDRSDRRTSEMGNPVARLQERADRMATTAAALKRIADAADPLYKTLDDGQKRRLMMLTHMEGRERWRERHFDRDSDRGGRGDWDRGERYRDRENRRDRGNDAPERL